MGQKVMRWFWRICGANLLANSASSLTMVGPSPKVSRPVADSTIPRKFCNSDLTVGSLAAAIREARFCRLGMRLNPVASGVTLNVPPVNSSAGLLIPGYAATPLPIAATNCSMKYCRIVSSLAMMGLPLSFFVATMNVHMNIGGASTRIPPARSSASSAAAASTPTPVARTAPAACSSTTAGPTSGG